MFIARCDSFFVSAAARHFYFFFLLGTMTMAGLGSDAHCEITLYRLSPLSLVPDNGVPKGLESLKGPVTLRIAPGQLDDLVVAISGGANAVPQVKVTAEPLKGRKGAVKIPLERVRTVVCYYGPLGGLGGPPDWEAKGSYRYEPFALFYDASLIRPNHDRHRTEITYTGFPDDNPPLKSRDIPAGQLRQWYITIPVPKDAEPGTYEGQLVFTSGRKELAKVNLIVEVLDISLLPPAKIYGMYTYLHLSLDDPRYLLMLKDLAEHGFHNPWLMVGESDIEKAMELRSRGGLDQDFVLWAEHGFHNPWLTAVGDKQQRIRRLSAYWKSRKYPPLIIYGVDEQDGEPLRKLAEGPYKAINEGGLKVGGSCSPGYVEYAGRWLNYPIMNGSLKPDAGSVSTAAMARKVGATILTYNAPQMIYHDPMYYRLRTGFNLWNSIYDGWFPFGYAWMLDQHECGTYVTVGGSGPVRGTYKWHGVVLVGKNRMIPQVEWPAMRQGVDDVRYATTLGGQVMKARRLGITHVSVDEADGLLRDLGAKVNNAAAIEAARSRIIDMILALQALDRRLDTRSLGGEDSKAVARKVNEWILPDLACRPFPMGMKTVGEKFAKMTSLSKDGKAWGAIVLGYALVEEINQARQKGLVNEVESFIAKGRVGSLLLQEEKKSLDLSREVFKRHLTVVAEIKEGWLFLPDRADRGLEETWYKPGIPRNAWMPIDVNKFWQKQGNPDWFELEGPRPGSMGIGWYALTLDIPADWKDRQLYLHFTVDDHAMVWANGRLVRVRDEGAGQNRWDTPTLAPLKESLKPGEANEVVIRVYNADQAGGLWRGLRIVEAKANQSPRSWPNPPHGGRKAP